MLSSSPSQKPEEATQTTRRSGKRAGPFRCNRNQPHTTRLADRRLFGLVRFRSLSGRQQARRAIPGSARCRKDKNKMGARNLPHPRTPTPTVTPRTSVTVTGHVCFSPFVKAFDSSNGAHLQLLNTRLATNLRSTLAHTHDMYTTRRQRHLGNPRPRRRTKNQQILSSRSINAAQLKKKHWPSYGGRHPSCDVAHQKTNECFCPAVW